MEKHRRDEELEAAALAATIEAFERQSLQEMHKRRRVEELDREEMHKWRLRVRQQRPSRARLGNP